MGQDLTIDFLKCIGAARKHDWMVLLISSLVGTMLLLRSGVPQAVITSFPSCCLYPFSLAVEKLMHYQGLEIKLLM